MLPVDFQNQALMTLCLTASSGPFYILPGAFPALSRKQAQNLLSVLGSNDLFLESVDGVVMGGLCVVPFPQGPDLWCRLVSFNNLSMHIFLARSFNPTQAFCAMAGLQEVQVK